MDIKLTPRDPKYAAYLAAGGDNLPPYEYLIFLHVLEKRYLEQFACGACVCQLHQIMKPRSTEAFTAYVVAQVEQGYRIEEPKRPGRVA